MSLNGTWKFSMEPPAKFWSNQADPSSWPEIQVPGEALMQGYNIKKDLEYAYKRKVSIPRDFSRKKIILRFDGVYSYARVWVNGHYIRDHNGGFTSLDCDITGHVTPGQTAWITVGVTDRSDEISWGSEYAKHNIGGILRDVTLVALPEEYVTRFQVETDLDGSYTDAVLKVTTALAFSSTSRAWVRLRLDDPHGNPVPLSPDSICLTPDDPEATAALALPAPLKWDAEHPNLYTLYATVEAGGVVLETLSKKVGFREIERVGNKLLVNGLEVKLRGVNRHDVHPTRGRSLTAELNEQDVLLFREANVNFIRTSHYPPAASFLDACDRYGMYVEEESAVCFVQTHGNLPTSERPEFTSNYLNQFSEMIERDRSHPCVIIWSLGNESVWGLNFKKEFDYVKSEDPGRPVIFSYPGNVPPGTRAYDIYSVHYIDFSDNMGAQSIVHPVLHDEYAHVACYNVWELRRDPGVRNFWGESIKRFGIRFLTRMARWARLSGAEWTRCSRYPSRITSFQRVPGGTASTNTGTASGGLSTAGGGKNRSSG